MIIDAPKPTHLSARRALWREAFGDTEEFLDAFEKTAFSPDRCLCISEGDEVLAALYWFDVTLEGQRLAYLYAIATAKAHRGKGLCHRLMTHAHAHLGALGYAGTLLVPSKPSLFALYEGLGYRTCSHIGELSCEASKATATLRVLSAKEYEAYRRTLLPTNGVLQENESIAFLETMASFYAGDGFLLAARREDGVLHGIELLGDVQNAPAVLAALGCTKGIFRIPVGNKPFAMYRPLSDTALPSPIYFGLALD